MSNTKKLITRLNKLRKMSSILGIDKRYMELCESYKYIKENLHLERNLCVKSALESELRQKIAWWETIFLKKNSVNKFTQEQWFVKLKKVLDKLPDKFLQRTRNENLMPKMIMKNIFQFLNSKPVYLSSPINWNDNPFGDIEWPTCLNRHFFLLNLAKAYLKSGEKKYVLKSKELFLDWASSQNLQKWKEGRFGWSTLNAGIRGSVWIRTFCMWYKAGILSGDFKNVAINVLSQNAEFLMKAKNPNPSNWQIFEAEGLFYMSMIFPDLTRSREWRKEALRRLKYEMARQVRKDGSHYENCPCYHMGMIRVFVTLFVFARETGFSSIFDDKYLKTVEKMCEFLLYTSTPDFKNLPIGDSGLLPISRCIELCNNIFNRDDFKYVITERKGGVSPKKTSCYLKPSGHIVFRSDWNKNARFLLFDMAEYGGGHSHYDIFNIHVYAYGKELICDSGRTTYQNQQKREYEKTSRHNTVTVDGKNQNILIPKCIKFRSKNGYGFVQAKSCNYEGVKHTRTIVFLENKHWLIIDSINSNVFHEYVLNFHTPQKNVRWTKNRLFLPHMILLPIFDKKCKIQLEKVRIGRDYNKTIAGKALRLKHKRSKNARFITLLATHENINKSPICTLKVNNSSKNMILITVKISQDIYKIYLGLNNGLCKIIH